VVLEEGNLSRVELRVKFYSKREGVPLGATIKKKFPKGTRDKWPP